MRDERTIRRRWLQCLGAVAGTAATAGCVGQIRGLLGGRPDASDVEIPYDTSVSHDGPGGTDDWTAPDGPPTGGYETETLAKRLEIPWDLAFAPNGELFLTERTGRLLRFDAGDVEPVTRPGGVIDAAAIEPGSDETPWKVEGGEGGLLGVAVHPEYPDPPLVYVYFTTDAGGSRENRVVAVDVRDGGDQWPVVTGIPADTYHNGGRITFGPENYLWIATGDGDPGLENPEAIADPGTLSGTVLRVEPDGTAPETNPDIDGGDPRIYTYGHRNPQGIDWLPDGTPVATEHGPSGGDEVNVLRAGENYGWPWARNTGEFDQYAETDYQPPVAEYDQWAPAGCCLYTGEAVPSLRNRLLVGGLISQQVVAVTLDPDGDVASSHNRVHDADWTDDRFVAGTDPLLTDEYGRIRYVEQGPDGSLYLLTSNRDGRAGEGFPTERDDRLLRLRPA
jgi:glucose/arabinose dehydrogenase